MLDMRLFDPIERFAGLDLSRASAEPPMAGGISRAAATVSAATRD